MTLRSEEVKSCIVVFSPEIVALSRLAAKDRRGLAHYIKGCPTLFSVYSTSIPFSFSLNALFQGPFFTFPFHAFVVYKQMKQ